jgi:hypothetical protein
MAAPTASTSIWTLFGKSRKTMPKSAALAMYIGPLKSGSSPSRNPVTA